MKNKTFDKSIRRSYTVDLRWERSKVIERNRYRCLLGYCQDNTVVLVTVRPTRRTVSSTWLVYYLSVTSVLHISVLLFVTRFWPEERHEIETVTVLSFTDGTSFSWDFSPVRVPRRFTISYVSYRNQRPSEKRCCKDVWVEGQGVFLLKEPNYKFWTREEISLHW